MSARLGVVGRLARVPLASLLPRSSRAACSRRPFCVSAQTDSENAEDPFAEYKTKIAALETNLSEETSKLNDKLKDMQDKYMRSLAETENVRTRMKKQVDDAKLFGIQGFCKDLLDVADILGKATESVPSEQLQLNQHLSDLFSGLTMTETQLQKVFSRHGLVKIAPEDGEKFDPNFHEALFEQPIPGKEGGTVAVTTKVGYKLHERTIRPALVGVVKEV